MNRTEDKAIRWTLKSGGEVYGQAIHLPSSFQNYPWIAVHSLRALADSLEKAIEKYDMKDIENLKIETKDFLYVFDSKSDEELMKEFEKTYA